MPGSTPLRQVLSARGGNPPSGISRRGLLAGAAGTYLLGSLPRLSAAAAGLSPISIANAAGALNLTLAALLRNLKLFESVGLEPKILNVGDGSRMLGAVLNGSVDASFMSGFGQVFPAIERGAGLKIIGGAALPPTLALFSSRPDIRTLKDLEGHTVGTGSIGALVHQLVVTLLHKYGVDVSRVTFANVGSSADAFRAVTAGTVDAGAGASALIPQARQRKVHLIEHGNMTVELRDYTFQGSWTSDRRIATHRDRLVRGLAAQAKLYRFLHTDAAKAPFIEARRTVFPGADMSDHEAEWNFISSYKPFATGLTLGAERLQYMQQLNLQFGVQQKVLPLARVADMSLAADAIKLLERK